LSTVILALVGVSFVSAFIPPTQHFGLCRLDILRNKAADTNGEDETQNNHGIFDNAKWTAGMAENLSGKGGSNIRSAADFVASRLRNVAQRGKSDVRSAASTLAGSAEKSSSRAKTAAEATASLLREMAGSASENAAEAARWMDGRAKDGVVAADARSKEFVRKFTGKKEYAFGDITKELVRRVASGEVNVGNTILLLKVVLAVGASFGPLAKLLPVTVLLEALNVSLEARIGGRILEALAGALDDRFQAAFTADDKVQLGDMTKRSLAAAVLTFTGKNSYEPGDIERTVSNDQKVSIHPDYHPENYIVPKTLHLRVAPEFEEWDRAFREDHPDLDLAIAESLHACNGNSENVVSQKALDMRIATELQEWDKMFKEKYPD